jgi:phage baseplate assembly protein W
MVRLHFRFHSAPLFNNVENPSPRNCWRDPICDECSSYGTSMHRYVDASVHRYAGTSVRRCVGASVRRYAGTPVRRYVGASVRRYVGAPVRRYVGASVRRCVGAP